VPPSFPRQNQAVVLWSPARASTVSPTGLSPSTAGLSRPLRLPWIGSPELEAPAGDPSTPHLSTVIPWRIGLGSPPFGRPYSGDPVVVSLPPPTKMFPFGGFPSGTPILLTEHGFPDATGYSPVAGSPIQRSRVQRLPAPTPGLSQLTTAFLGARAEPSTGRRLLPQSRGSLGGGPWLEQVYALP